VKHVFSVVLALGITEVGQHGFDLLFLFERQCVGVVRVHLFLGQLVVKIACAVVGVVRYAGGARREADGVGRTELLLLAARAVVLVAVAVLGDGASECYGM
jgi:hypothetical protein